MAELKTFYFDLTHAIKVHDMIIDTTGGRPGHDPQKVQMLSAYFLQLNGYDYCVTDFIYRMENIVVWVADNKIDKDLLKDIIEDIIMEQERESTQLALIHALSADENTEDDQ